MNRRAWIADSLPSDVDEAVRRLQATQDVKHVALMPDVHLAREVCVGTVCLTEVTLLPDAVGGDIGCGMSGIRLGVRARVLNDRNRAAAILDGLYSRVPVLRHARATRPALPAALDTPLRSEGLERIRQERAPAQLGTLGRGNHFLEIQRDTENDDLWLLAHSGSRGIGPEIRAHYGAIAIPDPDTGIRCLSADSDEGQNYLHDMAWARAFARANRTALIHRLSEITIDVLGADPDESSSFDSDHNHVEREVHDGLGYFVHRKGAQRAREGEVGVVPGSMGTRTFHVEGRGHAAAFDSCAHGAGRLFSRAEARKRVSKRQLWAQTEGVYFDRRLSSRLRDEAPSAYKDIGKVMRAQSELVRITRELEPVLVFKGV